MFHTGRCRNPWLGIPFIIHGYPINPWLVVISLSKHGDLIIFQWFVMTFSNMEIVCIPDRLSYFPNLEISQIWYWLFHFPTMEISKIQEWTCHFPNMETILILEWIFYLPSLENGNNILFWIIYYPKLYFLLILSWILQFPFLSSPGYISVPGLEFVLTLTGYFLINQTWGNCIFSKLGFFLKSRKYPGENQVKTGLDFSHFFLCSVKILRK